MTLHFTILYYLAEKQILHNAAYTYTYTHKYLQNKSHRSFFGQRTYLVSTAALWKPAWQLVPQQWTGIMSRKGSANDT